MPEGVDVRGIAKCRPLPDELRPAAWLACLDIQQDVDDGLMTFTNIYDLPEQQLMRQDIQQLVGGWSFCCVVFCTCAQMWLCISHYLMGIC